MIFFSPKNFKEVLEICLYRKGMKKEVLKLVRTISGFKLDSQCHSLGYYMLPEQVTESVLIIQQE